MTDEPVEKLQTQSLRAKRPDERPSGRSNLASMQINGLEIASSLKSLIAMTFKVFIDTLGCGITNMLSQQMKQIKQMEKR